MERRRPTNLTLAEYVTDRLLGYLLNDVSGEIFNSAQAMAVRQFSVMPAASLCIQYDCESN